jgi:hypothetical protein
MKTKKTNRFRSAADKRVASGVARAFGAPRLVIKMVKPKKIINFKCLFIELNFILFNN